MEMTQDLINRAKKGFEGYAKEEVQVEYSKGFWFVYGSELACLRLFRVYNGAKSLHFGFSKNLNTYYISYDSGC